MKTFEFQMETFGYEVDFDPMSCYPLINLYKSKTRVYEYRANQLNYQLTTSKIDDILTLEELLIDAYWSYKDYLILKSDYSKIKDLLDKQLPKHLVIKRHFKHRIN